MSYAGFSAATDEQLMTYANPGETLSRKSFFGLLLDEMHVKEGLVFNKNTGGFVRLGDINNAFINYANSKSENDISSLNLFN